MRGGLAVLIGCLLLLAVCPGLAATGSTAAAATPVREADVICAKCHETIFRDYLTTPMANASGLASERLIAGTFLHAPSSVEYQISAEGGSAWLAYRKLTDSSVGGREKLDYFLGSGHLGLTYLYTKNGYLLESPAAYYPDLKAYAMKPGLENMRRFPGALSVDSGCLRCHMSGVRHAEAGTENRYAGLPFLHTGITCEGCHGDTARHVATNGSAAVVNPARLDPARRDATCMVCHLEGASNVERRDRSALDYKPGDDIADYLTYFDYVRGKTTERAVSEIEQFISSKCKRVSGAGMSCMNCHDPHRSPAPEERASVYRAKCLICHSQAKYATAHYAGNPDCTSCHMPKTGAKNIAHVAWTDHRILARPGVEDAAMTSLADKGELVSIAPDGGSARDLALAYYDLAVKGNASARPRALAMLTAAAQSAPDDTMVLTALGFLSGMNGENARSQQLYRTVLKLDPSSLAANTNLGTLLAKSGDLAAAAALWRKAFAQNEDVLALGQNLATVECLLGERDRAIAALEKVLVYSPDSPAVRGRLVAISNGSEHCPASQPPLALQDR